MACKASNSLILVADEDALINAIDQKSIQTWNDFEYILSVIIENRILRVYQSHLEKVFQNMSQCSFLEKEEE